MGLLATIGTVAGGALIPIPGVGSAIGGMLGGMLESGGKQKATELDNYTAYKLQQEKEWTATYGPIEKNLVAHYENMSTHSYINKGNGILEQQHKAAMDRLGANLTARGLDIKGGISNSFMAESLRQLETEKTNLHMQADDYVAKQQQSFYASMQAGKPNAGNAVAANAKNNLALTKYNDKQDTAGMTAAIDLGGKIFKGLDKAGIPSIGGG